jgi:hypothetical protein
MLGSTKIHLSHLQWELVVWWTNSGGNVKIVCRSQTVNVKAKRGKNWKSATLFTYPLIFSSVFLLFKIISSSEEVNKSSSDEFSKGIVIRFTNIMVPRRLKSHIFIHIIIIIAENKKMFRLCLHFRCHDVSTSQHSHQFSTKSVSLFITFLHNISVQHKKNL